MAFIISPLPHILALNYSMLFDHYCRTPLKDTPEVRALLYSGHFAMSQICFLNEDTSLYRLVTSHQVPKAPTTEGFHYIWTRISTSHPMFVNKFTTYTCVFSNTHLDGLPQFQVESDHARTADPVREVLPGDRDSSGTIFTGNVPQDRPLGLAALPSFGHT